MFTNLINALQNPNLGQEQIKQSASSGADDGLPSQSNGFTDVLDAAGVNIKAGLAQRGFARLDGDNPGIQQTQSSSLGLFDDAVMTGIDPAGDSLPVPGHVLPVSQSQLIETLETQLSDIDPSESLLSTGVDAIAQLRNYLGYSEDQGMLDGIALDGSTSGFAQQSEDGAQLDIDLSLVMPELDVMALENNLSADELDAAMHFLLGSSDDTLMKDDVSNLLSHSDLEAFSLSENQIAALAVLAEISKTHLGQGNQVISQSLNAKDSALDRLQTVLDRLTAAGREITSASISTEKTPSSTGEPLTRLLDRMAAVLNNVRSLANASDGSNATSAPASTQIKESLINPEQRIGGERQLLGSTMQTRLASDALRLAAQEGTTVQANSNENLAKTALNQTEALSTRLSAIRAAYANLHGGPIQANQATLNWRSQIDVRTPLNGQQIRAIGSAGNAAIPAALTDALNVTELKASADSNERPILAATKVDPQTPLSQRSGSVTGLLATPDSVREARNSVQDQVMQAITRQNLANGRINLQLTPRELGALDLEFRQERGEVAVSIVARETVTRELLDSLVPRLRQQLEQAGVALSDLDVRQDNGADHDQRALAQENHQQAGAQATMDAESPEGTGLHSVQRRSPTHDGGFDLYV